MVFRNIIPNFLELLSGKPPSENEKIICRYIREFKYLVKKNFDASDTATEFYTRFRNDKIPFSEFYAKSPKYWSFFLNDEQNEIEAQEVFHKARDTLEYLLDTHLKNNKRSDAEEFLNTLSKAEEQIKLSIRLYPQEVDSEKLELLYKLHFEKAKTYCGLGNSMGLNNEIKEGIRGMAYILKREDKVAKKFISYLRSELSYIFKEDNGNEVVSTNDKYKTKKTGLNYYVLASWKKGESAITSQAFFDLLDIVSFGNNKNLENLEKDIKSALPLRIGGYRIHAVSLKKNDLGGHVVYSNGSAQIFFVKLN